MFFQVHQADHFLDAILDLGTARLAHAQAKPDVLSHRHIGEQSVRLKYHPHVALIGRLVCDIGAVQRNRAIGWALKSCDHTQGRCFSAARGTQERNKLALFHIEVEILNGVCVSELL